MLQSAVVCQQDQSFGVIVQSASGIDIGYVDMVGQGGTRLVITELAEGLERFVEQDKGSHPGILTDLNPFAAGNGL